MEVSTPHSNSSWRQYILRLTSLVLHSIMIILVAIELLNMR